MLEWFFLVEAGYELVWECNGRPLNVFFFLLQSWLPVG